MQILSSTVSQFRKELSRSINRCPKSITFHTADGQQIANIKAKASKHIAQHPRGKAVFDCMFRPIFH